MSEPSANEVGRGAGRELTFGVGGLRLRGCPAAESTQGRDLIALALETGVGQSHYAVQVLARG